MIHRIAGFVSPRSEAVALKLQHRWIRSSSAVCFLLTIVRNPVTLDMFVRAVHDSSMFMEDISDELQGLDVQFYCLPLVHSEAVLHVFYRPMDD